MYEFPRFMGVFLECLKPWFVRLPMNFKFTNLPFKPPLNTIIEQYTAFFWWSHLWKCTPRMSVFITFLKLKSLLVCFSLFTSTHKNINDLEDWAFSTFVNEQYFCSVVIMLYFLYCSFRGLWYGIVKDISVQCCTFVH